MGTKWLFLSLCVGPALSGCSHVQFPDFKLYSVAGSVMAGADYAYTGHDETGEISMQELFKILEDGAIIMESKDFKRQKIASEQACVQLGAACSFEILQAIQKADERTSKLGAPKE